MTEYVPVTVAMWHRANVVGKNGKITKAALREALRENPNAVEFRSESTFHRLGSYLTVAEAVAHIGDCVLQVHDPLGTTVAVVTPNHDGSMAVVS